MKDSPVFSCFNHFDDYFLETAIPSLKRPELPSHISIWIEEYDHSPEDSFIVCGQYHTETESFTISDLHSKEDAESYLKSLMAFLILVGISWRHQNPNLNEPPTSN